VSAVPEIERLKDEIDTGYPPIEQLAAASELAARLRARADELLDAYVDGARASRASWSEIGSALGTSKQAAQQRFAALSTPPPGAMPQGLSEPATRAFSSAALYARELGHHYIAPEHLVLGLLAQPQELAAEVLAELGVTLEGAREQVVLRLGSGAARPAGSLGVSPQTKRLLELARALAKSLCHQCPRTEHILLAATSPKLHSPAAALLSDCGAGSGQVRDQLVRALVHEAPELAERLRNRSLLSRVRLRV
jgi:hypothetical protein